MQEQMLEVGIEGLGELRETLLELARKYPDCAGDMLMQEAKELRKDVVKAVKTEKKSKKTGKKSLTRAGSYRISPIQNVGDNQYIEISAKSPHFHLVEHGHVLVRGRKAVGFVQGKHMMGDAVRKHEGRMAEKAEAMVNELLKKEGLA